MKTYYVLASEHSAPYLSNHTGPAYTCFLREAQRYATEEEALTAIGLIFLQHGRRMVRRDRDLKPHWDLRIVRVREEATTEETVRAAW